MESDITSVGEFLTSQFPSQSSHALLSRGVQSCSSPVAQIIDSAPLAVKYQSDQRLVLSVAVSDRAIIVGIGPVVAVSDRAIIVGIRPLVEF